MIRVLRIREKRGIGGEGRNEGIMKESKRNGLVLRISASKRSTWALRINLGHPIICNCPEYTLNHPYSQFAILRSQPPGEGYPSDLKFSDISLYLEGQ